jgi:hypothetical protein
MADSFNYALTLNDNGVYVLRSTVESFNLQQVTDKDIISFYQNFSNSAVFDTGLLPLDGTGVLAIRAAGNHMQVTVQHKPGLYYINWGEYEGQSGAKTYTLAQPYRIIIGDFVDGQLLGARMFYSPYPITHPDMPLYHVNLPNINCKGYRGNGVGWICLYLKEDWSNLPLNEKISRFIERCSGVETYNDANMSETDGPRFYQQKLEDNMDEDLSYLWNPQKWQDKSLNEGFDWTLNENLWIPVKVQSIDNQNNHDDNGIPLTLSGALLGNYRAYYTDNNIPKFYNVVAREDLNLSNEQVAKFVKKSFSQSAAIYSYNNLSNPLSSTLKSREDKSNSSPQLPFEEDESEDELFTCVSCDSTYTESDITYDVNGEPVCSSCITEHYVYLESVQEYYHTSDDNLYYDEAKSTYYHTSYDTVKICDNCDTVYCEQGNSVAVPVYDFATPKGEVFQYCNSCIESVAKDNNLTVVSCSCGSTKHISEFIEYTLSTLYIKKFLLPKLIWSTNSNPQTDEPSPVSHEVAFEYTDTTLIYCPKCVDKSTMLHQTCPCGSLVDSSDILKCSLTPVTVGDSQYQVAAACASCIGNIKPTDNGYHIGEYIPKVSYQLDKAIESGVILNSPYVVPDSLVDKENNEPF